MTHLPDRDNCRSSFNGQSNIVKHNISNLQNDNVCEELLGKKMIAAELNEETGQSIKGYHNYEGSDSGVDIAATLNICLKRALSSNSGDYPSSSCGIDTEPNVNLNENVSCGSSINSFASDLGGEHKSINTMLNSKTHYECCSENGSESSSVIVEYNDCKSSNFKKVNEYGSLKSTWKSISSTSSVVGHLNKPKTRLAAVTQNKSGKNVIHTRDRARSRETTEKSVSNISSKTTTPPFRSTPVRKVQKPDSLPCPLNSAVALRSGSQRTPSITRARTPGTPSDDGRWPSVGSKIAVTGIASKRCTSVTPDLGSTKVRPQLMSYESKCMVSGGMCSNTLPRRRKQKSVEDLRERGSRSSSNSRENGMLSSMTFSSRKITVGSNTTPSKICSAPINKTNYRKTISKTRIFHEMGIQTSLTGEDLDKSFIEGICRCIGIDSVKLAEKQTQSEIRDEEIERLREEIKRAVNKQNDLANKLEEKTQKVLSMEQQINKEREEKISLQRELNQNTERVIGMLELSRHTPLGESSCDSLMMLESQIQMSGHELVEKQHEIIKLRKLCRTLQTEMERALVAQECLMQEKISIEREANEMQDFLQHEKTAMCDALNESEFEYEICKKTLSEKEEEIKVLRDECRHLVRLNEQRRQENKLMQSKYAALESRSKDLRVHQNTSMSGSSLALTGLHTRLNSLVEQLITSYKISEQDLEDVVYHNEAYPNSASSCDETPEFENISGSLLGKKDSSISPQRNQSFIAAVISAIRNATASSGKRQRSLHGKNSGIVNEDESDSTEMLDSETEPCLMMDNVLEDVTMPDSHSHNLMSSTGIIVSQIELSTEIEQNGDESLHNLSQAITNRQQIESQMNSSVIANGFQFSKSAETMCEDISFHESVAEMPSLVEFCSTQGLVDQVIEVDNLITKLLKVLRLIQMDNDVCIQQLIIDKNKLQQNKEDMLEKLKDLQDTNIKLQDELMDATQELMLKSTDLSTTKADIQRHRNEIDRLNEDICQLSTLCSQNTSEFNTLERILTPESILKTLRLWNDQGYFDEVNVQNFLYSVNQGGRSSSNRHNIVEKTTDILNANSIQQIRGQYEAIDTALKTLNNFQNIVEENPSLQQLQSDLDKICSKFLKMLPLYRELLGISDENCQDLINANDPSDITEKYCYEHSGNQTQMNSSF